MRAIVATCVVALGACARYGAPPVAPVDVTVAAVAGVPAIPLARADSLDDRCTAQLKPGPIKTASGCTLDERLSQGPGAILYPCSGTGAVEAVFGEHHFLGSTKDGSVVLALTTEIDWEDGCHWQTKQTIRGVLQQDEAATLAWTYSEGPVRGASCFGACKASADIGVGIGVEIRAPQP